MPNKIISADFTESARADIYIVMNRPADAFLLANADGTFEAAPASYPLLTEAASRKKSYSITITGSLADGDHLFSVYAPIGATQDPTVDDHIAGGVLKIKDNAEIELDASVAAIQGVVSQGVPHFYYPTSIVRVIGSDEGGDVNDLAAHDEVMFGTGEVVGTGMEVIATFATSLINQVPSQIRIPAFYNGGATHYIEGSVWNYTLAAWELKFTMLSRTTAFDYTVGLTADHHDPATGEMKIRFKHAVFGTYNAGHRLWLDMIEVSKVESTSSLASDIALIRAQTDPLTDTLAAHKVDIDYIHDHTHSLFVLTSFLVGNFSPLGKMYWVNGITGNDGNSGKQGSKFATISRGLAELVDGNRDILLIEGLDNPYDEEIVLNKSHSIIIGSGLDCHIAPSVPTGPTVQILAKGVVFCGFGSIYNPLYHPILIDSVDDINIRHILCEGSLAASGQDGIHVNNCSYVKLLDSHIDGCGRNGILVTSDDNDVSVDIMGITSHSNGGNGIQIAGSQRRGQINMRTSCFLNGGYGMQIGGSNNTVYDNHVKNNASGEIIDVGTGNQIENNEQWARHEGTMLYLSKLAAATKNKIIGS